GVITLVRGARSWGDLLAKLGLAYLGGVCIAAIAAAELAVVGLAVGLLPLSLVAAFVLAAGVLRFTRRLEPRRATREERLWGSRLIGAAALGQTGLLLAVAGTALAVRPLGQWDGWGIWGMTARASSALRRACNPAIESHVY